MLDDPERLRKGDPQGMAGTLSSLPEQLEEGLERAADRVPDPPRGRLAVAGMGGSAIVGDLAAAATGHYGGPDVLVSREPGLPRGLGRDDLLVAVSYSGNTWETLAAYREALRRDLPCCSVGSGGQLAEIAAARGHPHVAVPRGLPPRGALGYLLAPLLALLAPAAPGLEADLPRAVEGLSGVRARWLPAVPTGRNPAKRLAGVLQGCTPVVYAPAPLAGVARRWQTQFNENAKVLAFHGVLTEAAHNEVVGWLGGQGVGCFAPVLLEAPAEPPWTPFLEALTELLQGQARLTNVRPSLDRFLPGLLELVLLGDLVSVYLALLREVDPWPVPPIDRLKEKLAARGLGGGSAEGEI